MFRACISKTMYLFDCYQFQVAVMIAPKTNLITGGQRSWVTVVDRILFGSHRSPQEVSYLPLDFIFCLFLPLEEGTHHQQPFLLSISRISCLPSGHRQQAFNSRSRQSENRLLAATRFGRFFPRVEKAEGASRASLGSKTFKFV